MEISKYEAFLSIVERGSYSKACDDLGYTLSGISKMMKSMETEIGFPLLLRTNQGVFLTKEGEQMLPKIRELVHMKNTIEEEFSLIKGIESGNLRIGCFPTLAFVFGPKIVDYFRKHHPNIKVEIVDDNEIRTLEKWLNQGIIDVALFSKQPYHKYHWEGLQTDRYVVAFPEDHPFSSLERVSIDAVFQEDYMLFQSQDGLSQDIADILEFHHPAKPCMYTANSEFIALNMIRQLGHVALIPGILAEDAEQLFMVDTRPVDVSIKREIGFAMRDKEHLSPAMRALVSFVRETL